MSNTSNDENENPTPGIKRKPQRSALLYPTKKPRRCPCSCFVGSFASTNNRENYSTKTDPMVGHGKHFGRTISAVNTVKALVTGALERMGRIGDGELLEEMSRK